MQLEMSIYGPWGDIHDIVSEHVPWSASSSDLHDDVVKVLFNFASLLFGTTPGVSRNICKNRILFFSFP